jgi:predicted butyrate kinase (DUF1464 family)
VEGIVKSVAALATSAPSAREVVLSGRLARLPWLAGQVAERLSDALPGNDVRRPGADPREPEPVPGTGFADAFPFEAALGAALLADGLCGGTYASVVRALRLKEATGSVLDHLYSPPARRGAERFLESLA